MFCSKCGNQCSDSGKFCPNCGNELNDSATEFFDEGKATESFDEGKATESFDEDKATESFDEDKATEFFDEGKVTETPASKSVEQPVETNFTLWDADETDFMQSQKTEVQPVVSPVEPPNTNFDNKPVGFVTNFADQQESAAEPVLPIQSNVKVAPQTPETSKPKKKKKISTKTIVVASIGVVLIVVAVVVAILLINNAKKDDTVKAQLSLGNKYLGSYNYEKAALAFENALEIEPDNYDAHCGYARALRGDERYDKATDEYLEAIELDSKAPAAYRELAELYIQVDKKDDAYDLIDSAVNDEKINDEDVLEVYKKMNPKKPTLSVPSGSYNTRNEIVLADPDGGSIYYTTDGTAPSSDSDVFNDPIILMNGDTEIKAITISDYGFESDVTEGKYYTNIPDKVVTFKDLVVENAVRDILGKFYGDEIYNDEVASITELSIVANYYDSNMNATFIEGNYIVENSYYYSSYLGSVETLADLKMMPFLKTLNIAYQEKVDISALAGCKSLQNLSLINMGLKNVNAISGLTGLKKLCLAWNDISDISKLSGMTSLTHLGLWRNKISDVSVVSKMPELVYLDFSDNKVSNISAVSSLNKLTDLWVYSNKISDFTPIVGLTSLRVLMLNDNPVNDKMDPIIKVYPRLTRIDVDIIKTGGNK